MACNSKKYFLTLLVFLFVTVSLPSKSRITSYTDEVPNGYNFWLYNPYDSVMTDTAGVVITHPLVIFLHGASLCGSNLDKVKTYGTIDAIEKGRKMDAYVVAPQNPGGSWNPHKVMRVVDWVQAHNPVDSNRIYVIGMSLGGYGTIDLTATYPNRIAAAMALCGGGTVNDLSGLNYVPLWIIHGTADRAVTIQQSDLVVEKMKRSNEDTPRLKYNRIEGMNHGQPAKFLYLADSYEWLLSHNLKDKDRKVNDTFEPTASTLQKAYQGLTFRNSPKRRTTKKSAPKRVRKKTNSHK